MPRVWWLVFATWVFFVVVLAVNVWHYGQVIV